MTFTIQGIEYRLHFRHIKHLPPKTNGDPVRWEPALRPHTSLTGVTLATIVTPALIAQGYAFCAAGDTYNKERGRMEALRRAIDSAKPLRAVAPSLIRAYRMRPRTQTLNPHKAPVYRAWRHNACGVTITFVFPKALHELALLHCNACRGDFATEEFTPIAQEEPEIKGNYTLKSHTA